MKTRTAKRSRRFWCAWLFLAIVIVVGPSCDGPPPKHAAPATTDEETIQRTPVSSSAQPIDTAPAASREHAIERTPIRSSALRSVGYDEEQQTLAIEFPNGAVYQYFNVPPEVYRGLMAAESHGRYFHQHVRDKSYQYQKMN